MKSKVLKLQLIEKQIISATRLMEDLTKGEYKIFEALVSFIDSNGFSPTLENIAEIMGVSKQAIHKTFKSLERKGYIVRKGYTQIELTYKDAKLAIENVEKLRPALEELKELHKSGLITDTEYDLKRRQILRI